MLFEFQYRWAQMAPNGFDAMVDELNARDEALEAFINDFPCNGGGSSSDHGGIRILDEGSPDDWTYTVTLAGTITLFEAEWPTGPQQYVLYVNGISSAVFGPTFGGISSPCTIPISIGDTLLITSIGGGAQPGTVFMTVDGYTSDINTVWNA